MRLTVEKNGANRPAFQIELSDLLAPLDGATGMPDAKANSDAIGQLAALLVQKGVLTIPEAQRATGTDDHTVLGKPEKG